MLLWYAIMWHTLLVLENLHLWQSNFFFHSPHRNLKDHIGETAHPVACIVFLLSDFRSYVTHRVLEGLEILMLGLVNFAEIDYWQCPCPPT